ncbi:MAG TPA: biotin/lipoyl-containing protein, partial [Terriglobales bacterium]|nr:biotin/lipoyl-containing protein [Terriglobales bacterium]
MAELREIKVPDIGDFEAVDVVEVLVESGAHIEADQSLITIESEKASMEVPSPVAGTVKEVKVRVGDKVGEGAVIVTVEVGGADAGKSAPAAAKSAPEPATAAPAAKTPAPPPAQARPSPSAAKGKTPAETRQPAADKPAAQATADDVEPAAEAQPEAPPGVEQPHQAPRGQRAET